MNAKLIVAIVLAVLLITGGVLEVVFIEKTLDAFSSKVSGYLENGFTVEQLQETHDWWLKKSKIVELTIPYTQLIEISVTYSELLGAVKIEDFDSANALLTRVLDYIVQVKHVYGFNFSHVL